MAELDEMKEVKRVLVGPLISNNLLPCRCWGLFGAGGDHQAGNRIRHDYRGNAGDGVFQHILSR